MKKKKETTNKKQKYILIISIIAITASIFLITKTLSKNSQIDEDLQTKTNDLLKDTQIGDLIITNVNLNTHNNISSYMATVTNNKAKPYYVKNLYVIFTTNNQKEKILALSNVTINPNKHAMIDIILDINPSEITNIEYKFD